MPTAYISAPTDEAADIAETLVRERYAACVNRVECASTYRWEGEVVEATEELLLAKTTADRYPALVDRVRELHPHDVPCVERFDEADELEGFAAWKRDAVAE